MRELEYAYVGASTREWPHGGWASCWHCHSRVELAWWNGLAYLATHFS